MPSLLLGPACGSEAPAAGRATGADLSRLQQQLLLLLPEAVSQPENFLYIHSLLSKSSTSWRLPKITFLAYATYSEQ